jgi:hypothetical protein
LSSEELIEVFKTDATIAAFWAKSESDQIQVWGEQLDLEAIQ